MQSGKNSIYGCTQVSTLSRLGYSHTNSFSFIKNQLSHYLWLMKTTVYDDTMPKYLRIYRLFWLFKYQRNCQKQITCFTSTSFIYLIVWNSYRMFQNRSHLIRGFCIYRSAPKSKDVFWTFSNLDDGDFSEKIRDRKC